MSIMQMFLGAAGAGEETIEDLFQTKLWTGSSSTITVSDGVKNLSKGGLLWIKRRNGTGDGSAGSDESSPHFLFSTEHLATSTTSDEYLNTDSNNPLATLDSTGTITWTNSGYTVPSGNSDINENGDGDYVAWNFRKGEGFFDIVKWDGNSTNRTIPHELGSVPGFIMVKSHVAGTGGTGWMCYHRSSGATKFYRMDTDREEQDNDTVWNDTEPTSLVFTVGTHEDVNTSTNSREYIAYVFGHTDGLIDCGTYNGDSSDQTVDCGFSNGSSWIMVKPVGADSWWVFDVERGITTGNDPQLYAGGGDLEDTGNNNVKPHSSGFIVTGSSEISNSDGRQYVYVAIAEPD
tara:strand:- start:45 stop:1085 length:1041 start_codon:yes stop_codon:yes gene_type:complete